MRDVMNPQAFYPSDIGWSATFVVIAAITLLAIYQISRSSMSFFARTVWIVAVVVAPVVGVLAWFLFGRRPQAQPARQTGPTDT